jgi:MFS transporter, DHA3 family, macrolide efflux protein
VKAGKLSGDEGGRGGDSTLSRFSGLGRFGVIWVGQLVTLIGNALLRFAFVIHAWTTGGKVTDVALLSVCATLPQAVLSPTAGAIVDRCRKEVALRISDASGLVIISGLTFLYYAGNLQLWEIYLAVICLGCASAFAFPALSSAVPLLVPRTHLQRANGLLGSANSGASIFGPALAAVLLRVAGLGSILWMDLITFVVSLVSVYAMPRTERPTRHKADGSRRSITADTVEGIRFLFAQRGLRGLMLVDFGGNLVMVFGYAVMQPMVLARTGDSTGALAAVLACTGLGGIVGGLALAAWGGPEHRVRGMMLGMIGMCLTSLIGMGLARDVPGWCVGMFLGMALMPMINSTMQAIVQTGVPAELQGRVFGAMVSVSQISLPVATVTSGVLADHVFDPQAASESGLVGVLRPVVGSGVGTGMAVMLILAGLLGIGIALLGMRNRAMRVFDLPEPQPGSEPGAQRGPGSDAGAVPQTVSEFVPESIPEAAARETAAEDRAAL